MGDPVDFETGFFKDEAQIDIKKHIWMYAPLLLRLPILCKPRLLPNNEQV